MGTGCGIKNIMVWDPLSHLIKDEVAQAFHRQQKSTCAALMDGVWLHTSSISMLGWVSIIFDDGLASPFHATVGRIKIRTIWTHKVSYAPPKASQAPL